MVTVEVPAERRAACRREVPATLIRMVAHGVLLQLSAQLVLQLGGDQSLTAWLFAAQFVGLLLSLAYVEWGRGCSPLTLVFWPEVVARLALLAALPVGLFATPAAEPGLLTALLGVSFAASHLASPMMGAIYGAIYPHTMRGRIVAFGRMLQGTVAIVALWGIGSLLDADPKLYAYVLPVIGLIGLVSTWWFCRLPRTGFLAGAAAAATATATAAGASGRHGSGHPPSSRRRTAAGWRPGRQFAFWHVLTTDRNYARYQGYQFLLGLANLSGVPVLAIYVYDVLKLSIAEAMWVVNAGIIMNAMILLTVRFHGRLFDWIGVLSHRTLTSVIIAVGWIVLGVSGNFAGACVAAVLMGFGRAGGQIVWLIGSLSFAPRHLQGVYSGIHTFLTGLRGAVAPALGVVLLTLPGSPFAGRYDLFFVFVGVLVLVSAVGHAWFVTEPRAEQEEAAAVAAAAAAAQAEERVDAAKAPAAAAPAATAPAPSPATGADSARFRESASRPVSGS